MNSRSPDYELGYVTISIRAVGSTQEIARNSERMNLLNSRLQAGLGSDLQWLAFQQSKHVGRLFISPILPLSPPNFSVQR